MLRSLAVLPTSVTPASSTSVNAQIHDKILVRILSVMLNRFPLFCAKLLSRPLSTWAGIPRDFSWISVGDNLGRTFSRDKKW